MAARQNLSWTSSEGKKMIPPVIPPALGTAAGNGSSEPCVCPLVTGCSQCPWSGIHAEDLLRVIERSKRSRLRPLLFFFLALSLLAFYLAGENGPGAGLLARAKRLAALSLTIEKPMQVAIAKDFDVSASFNHSFSVPLSTNIPVRLPVKTVLKVPIFENFQVGLNKPFAVSLKGPLHLEENIRVTGDLPIETVVEAKVLGVATKVPIRGVVPVNFVFPLKQDFRMPESIPLTIVEPLPVDIEKVVEAPIDFVVEGNLPLRQDITVPLREAIPCKVRVNEVLPLTMKLNLAASDWGEGLKLGENGESAR
ncbi:MAG: hypothetical protein AB1921_15755 [Thermodesulfobacteriota bacterium]